MRDVDEDDDDDGLQPPPLPPDEPPSPEALQALARDLGVDLDKVMANAAQAAQSAAAPQPVDQQEDFHLWPEHEDVLRLFNGCCTQWRCAGMSAEPTGLDYAGVRASAAWYAIAEPRREAVMADLHWLERAWLRQRRKSAAEQRDRARQPMPR